MFIIGKNFSLKQNCSSHLLILRTSIFLLFFFANILAPDLAHAAKITKCDLALRLKGTPVQKKYLDEIIEKIKPFEKNRKADISITYQLGDYLKPDSTVVVLDNSSGDLIRITDSKGNSEVLKVYSNIHWEDCETHYKTMKLLRTLGKDGTDTGFSFINIEKVDGYSLLLREDDVRGVDLRKLLEGSDDPEFKGAPLSTELKVYLRKLYDQNVRKLKSAILKKGWKPSRTTSGPDGTFTSLFDIPGPKKKDALLHPQLTMSPWAVKVQFDGKSIRMVFVGTE